MSRLAIIPARKGSKGLKDKNIKILCGKPLMAYTIESAVASGMFDRIILSTDSPEYALTGEKYGAEVPFLRSEETSGDLASSWDVVREVIERLNGMGDYYDEIMLLQVTSPLRNEADIKNCVGLMSEKEANAIISLSEMEHSPLWCNTVSDDLNIDDFEKDELASLPRQQLPVYYRENGAIFYIKTDELYKKKMFSDRCYAYIMPKERSIDIDDEFDLKMAEFIMSYYSDQNQHV